jgi:hypothetical protein
MQFDNKGFRGNPDPYEPIQAGLMNIPKYNANRQQQPVIYMQPLHGGADVRPKCASNIPVGQQFATRQLIMKHADNIINLSRKRHEERLIDALPQREGTVHIPGFELVTKCTPNQCMYSATGSETGIGVYREEPVPELTGTWSNAYIYPSTEGFSTFRSEEGGRNTKRG